VHQVVVEVVPCVFVVRWWWVSVDSVRTGEVEMVGYLSVCGKRKNGEVVLVVVLVFWFVVVGLCPLF
jgi:hypothetical protein